MVVNDLAPDIDQTTVFNSRRTRRFTVATRQAPIQMQLRFGGDFVAFENLFDQIDASARSVELVTEQLISRARGGAEAAMHALAQDGIRLLAFGRVLDEIGERSLHQDLSHEAA